MSPLRCVIAIDGPGAVGKTTVGRLLAKRLGYLFIDTGNMYRALTWLSLKHGIDPEDEGALTELARRCVIELRQPKSLESRFPEEVWVNGKQVTEDIKQPDVDTKVSIVSKHPKVRTEMVTQQRRLAGNGVVMVGRDIGTVVLPDAALKIFLTASLEERARRRHMELASLGLSEACDAIIASLAMRDKIDSEREASPLVPAEDSHQVNTDDLYPEQVVEQIMGLFAQVCSKGGVN